MPQDIAADVLVVGAGPVGLSLAAPGGHDRRLLALALAVEAALSRAAP